MYEEAASNNIKRRYILKHDDYVGRRGAGNYMITLEINFARNYLPDLRITEIVLSGEPATDFDFD